MGSARKFHTVDVGGRKEPACWSWAVVRPDEVEMDELFIKLGYAESRSMRELLAFEAYHANRCAMCGRESKRLVRDHCHASNLVRGFLCVGCNRLESGRDGVFEEYRHRNPATILDYWEPYDGDEVRRELFGSPPPIRSIRARDREAQDTWDGVMRLGL